LASRAGNTISYSSIIDIAVKIITDMPEGIGMSELKKRVYDNLGGKYDLGTIGNAIWNIADKRSKIVERISRGVVALKGSAGAQTPACVNITASSSAAPTASSVNNQRTNPTPTVISEEAFYLSFAYFLQNDMEEATKAIPLGRNYFVKKWRTPDVFGISKPKDDDRYKYPMEIVSAEIKTSSDIASVMESFGQANSYKEFCHLVYIVLPNSMQSETKSRIEALCKHSGIGLVLFDANNVDDPNYIVCIWAKKDEPIKKSVKEVLNSIHCKDLF